ncbi:MAG: SpoIIE family protein phosphatase [Oscillospiraceae bacterium]|nr:SpoIIE family protein phosphatase [Oscillospiraceae bacterium]
MKRLQKTDPSETLSSLRCMLLRLVLGCLLSAHQLFGGYAPYALGFTAAMGGGYGGLSAMAGTLAGAALFMDFNRALRLGAVSVLIFSANSSFAGTKAARHPLFLPVMSAILTASVELIYLINGDADLVEVTEGISAMVLAGLAAYSFPRTLTLPRTPRETFADIALLAAVFGSLTEIVFPGNISLGRLLLGALTMTLAYRSSISTAAAGGLGLGLLLDLRCGGRSLFFTGAYGLGALFLSSRRESGRLIAGILFNLVVVFFLYPAASTLRVPIIEETLLSTLLYLVIPTEQAGRRIAVLADKELPRSPAERLRRQLEQTALAFRELAESFPRCSSAEESPSILFDRAAENTCRSCGLNDVCWKREYESTLSACNDAAAKILRRGMAEGADFPAYFSSRCPHFPDFLDAVNSELSAFLLRQQYRLRLRQARSSARGQYLQLSDLLARTAEDLTLRAIPAVRARPLAYEVGTSLRPKRGEAVSGDSCLFFESDSGRMLYLLLSDGMGCGRDAQAESSTAVRLLERFLRSDVPAEAALQTLNAAFSLRSEEGGGFTTIDLLAVDLYTAEAVLYKYGAAPSFLRQDGQVRRISGASLPAGLEPAVDSPDITRLHLGSGATLLMTSDGISETETDRWMQQLLQQCGGQNPRALAALFMVDSLSHGGEQDDCTVMVLSIAGGDVEV